MRSGSHDEVRHPHRGGPRHRDRAASGALWNATCNAPWACAGIASSGPSSSARTDRSFARSRRPFCQVEGHYDDARKPKLAVFKFASCDGCQLSLLDAEDELLAVADKLRVRAFSRSDRADRARALTTSHWSKARSPRLPMRERIREIRRQCRVSGHDRRLRHRRRHPGLAELGRPSTNSSSAVYARPEYIKTLATSTAIAEHVPVDFELRGCPINTRQLLEVLRRPACRAAGRGRRSHASASTANGKATCASPWPGNSLPGSGDAMPAAARICPTYDRGCYGCFGPAPQAESGEPDATIACHAARPRDDIVRLLRSFNGYAPGIPRGKRSPGLADDSPASPNAIDKPHDATDRARFRVEALTRVEGEGGLFVRLCGDRVDERASSTIFEPPRFFEALLRGRALRRSARHHGADLRHLPGRLPDERGTCPGSGAAAVIRRADSRDLRRLLYCGEWIESHVLHMHLLHAPDFLGYRERPRHGRATFPRRSIAGCALKKHGNQLLALFGGRAIHPINVAVGGFYRLPDPGAVARLIPDFEWGLAGRDRSHAVDGLVRISGIRRGL